MNSSSTDTWRPVPPNSITGTSITYTSPILIIRYKTTKGAISSYIPNGYLKYNAVETKWELEEVNSLYQELLDNQAILAYSDGRKFFNSYQYSYNGLQWIDFKRGHIFEIIVDSSVPSGSLSAVYNSKLFIRLKDTTLNYVYNNHPDFMTPFTGSSFPFHTPYEDTPHIFSGRLLSQFRHDIVTFIRLDPYLTTTRYYGERNTNIFTLDFEVGDLRDLMVNNHQYKMMIFLTKEASQIYNIIENFEEYFFIKKIDLATGEGGGVDGGGGGGLA